MNLQELSELTDEQLECLIGTYADLTKDNSEYHIPKSLFKLLRQLEQEKLDRIHRHEMEEAESLQNPIYRYDHDK